jgi:protein-arginine kinase activator protein McsA
MEDESDAGMPKGTWMLELLRRRLQAAVDREEFEEAARLRDRIESIKREQGGESGAE